MPLTGQDFQDVRVGLQDLLRAVQENTETLRRATPGGPANLGTAPAGTRAGATPEGEAPAPQRSGGFALSSLGKMLTATSPATGALGTIGAAAASGGPIGMAVAATGFVAQGVQRSMQASMDTQIESQSARLDTYVSSVGRGETRDQAIYRANMARENAGDRMAMERENKEAAAAWTDSNREYHLGRAEQRALSIGFRERMEHRAMDPEMRAQQRTDQIMANAMRYGALDTKAGQENYRRVYEVMHMFEERTQRAQDIAIEIRQRSNAARNGAQGSAHKAGP